MSPAGRGFPFSAVVGQDDLRLALVLLAVDPGIGGVVIRGQKGTAKTTAVRGLAELIPGDAGGSAPFVELPLGATEDRVVGSLDLDTLAGGGAPRFRPGLLGAADGGVLYVDEVNLLADHLVDVLLDAAATGTLTVERDGISHSGPARFALVGTMNPEEGELRPQLLDRFGLAVDVAGPSSAGERVEIVRRRRAFDADPEALRARFAADDAGIAAEIAAARALLSEVVLTDRELERIALVCLEIGVEGMRADVVIARTAAAHAALRGRRAVTEADVRAAARLALPHRRRRDPFDPAELDPADLDRSMDRASEQLGPDDPDPTDPDGTDPDTDPEGPDAGGEGPEDAGPDDTARDDAAPEDAAAGEGGDAAPEAGGRGPEDRSGEPDGPRSRPEGSARPDASDADHGTEEGEDDAPGAPASPIAVRPDERRSRSRVTRLGVEGTGHGAAGRRSAAETATGRLVSAPSGARSARIHVLDTVRASLLRRASGTDARGLTSDDLRWGVRRGREGNLVVFLVDTSGSMSARRRLDLVTGSCVALLRDAYVRRDLVAVVEAHGSGARVAVPPTRSVDVAVRRLAGVETGGRTPLAEGLTEVTELLRRHRAREPERRAVLVVLTDGRATAGRDAMPRALAAARGLRALRLAAPLVVDCEHGRVRLGAARALAAALGAPVMELDALGDDDVARMLRAA